MLPFPSISSSPAMSPDKFSSGQAIAKGGAQGEREEKQGLESVTLSPASGLAELCQGNLIPAMHANKTVPSGTAQITTWKQWKSHCGMDVSGTCCAGLGVCKMGPWHQPGGLATTESREKVPADPWCETSAEKRQELQ